MKERKRVLFFYETPCIKLIVIDDPYYMQYKVFICKILSLQSITERVLEITALHINGISWNSSSKRTASDLRGIDKYFCIKITQ